jgi:phosphocarrier protein HPr
MASRGPFGRRGGRIDNRNPMDYMNSPPMSRSVQIVNRAGMHARPAAEFVKLAGRYKAEIEVSKDGLRVNGKSIMGVLMLAAECGSELMIYAQGQDASEALDGLTDLVGRGFEEA